MLPRYFLPILALAAALSARNAAAWEPEATEANPVAKPTVIVVPEYPKGIAPDRPEVKIEVRGTVTADGDFVDPSFAHEPGDEAFAQAVRDVLKFWRFAPAADEGACVATRSSAVLFVWFARKEGKPAVSVSMPARGATASRKLVFRYRQRIAYPEDALRNGVEGATILLARVHKSGKVEAVAIRSKGVMPSFDAAALKGFGPVAFEPFDPADWKGKEVICAEYEVLYCINGPGVALANPQCKR